MLIDLHLHTTASDGTDSPKRLFEKAYSEGYRVISITDHDTDSGCEEILPDLKGKNILFIPGIEFSCKNSFGKCHILGYAYRDGPSSVKELIQKAHNLRIQKVFGRLRFIREKFGFDFGSKDVEKLLKNKNPGKPHIANLMVKKGYCSSRQEGIELYLNDYDGKEGDISSEEAVQAIIGSGGIPVLAHPIYGDWSKYLSEEILEERISFLKDCGLMGLECYYSRYSEKEQSLMCSMAERMDLMETAGSDYHGKNKEISLGQHGLAAEASIPERVRSFLEECEKRIGEK